MWFILFFIDIANIAIFYVAVGGFIDGVNYEQLYIKSIKEPTKQVYAEWNDVTKGWERWMVVCAVL